MQPQSYASLADAAAGLAGRPLHLAIGMFDGVHLGHRAVIESAVQSARRSDGTSAVLTFWPHPSAVLRPASPTPLILDQRVKERVIFGLGVDALVTQRFDAEFARIGADAFLPHLKKSLPNLVAVYVGENWRFGSGRKGDVGLLVAEGRKIGLTVFSAPRVNLDGEPISSSRIREALGRGEIESVNAMLGYTYFCEGRVVAGKGLGAKIGFPTLNVDWSPQVRPDLGVYAVYIRYVAKRGGVSSENLPAFATGFRAIANYGLRPTVENATEPRLEVHVLGDCPFKAGDELRVEWQRFVRPEMKFRNVDELRAQIEKDVAAI